LQERIVELDKANKELVLMKRSEKFAATGRIARTIAHEVRNPLTNIDLAMSQIKNDMPAEDDGSTMLFNMVERNSKRINQLISELLSATRFAELSYVSVSINKLLDESLEMARDRIELNQITVVKKYGVNICDISVDAEKIRIAFLNIIVNAVEAMEPGKGILEIVTKGEEDKCVVEISDNGYGMTEEQLNNLFEPYFTTKPDGNGLGLTNTQNIILNHKGAVNVISAPGVGTSFIIKFNFADPM
jgi:signal transduction histidine kinase